MRISGGSNPLPLQSMEKKNGVKPSVLKGNVLITPPVVDPKRIIIYVLLQNRSRLMPNLPSADWLATLAALGLAALTVAGVLPRLVW